MRAGKPYQAAAGLGEDGEVSQVFDDIHTSLRNSEIQMHPPMSYQIPPTESASVDTPSAEPAPVAETQGELPLTEPDATVAKAAS